ncbi:Hypothetical protein HDN1F_15210 [gamma proteobacterium HdN1]|nr:Hypothetical protein HDN1F_15210 [gamma proteobacterium HdN1]
MMASASVFALSMDANRNKQILWPEGSVPYLITKDKDLSAEDEARMRPIVLQRIADWNNVGDNGKYLNLFPISQEQTVEYPTYLAIDLRPKSNLTDCGAVSQHVNKNGGAENASGYPGIDSFARIALPASCPGAITHEIGHVIGFKHEQTRKDSNIVLNFCNYRISNPDSADCRYKSATANGSAQTLWANESAPKPSFYLSDYDPFSIMHYSLQNNLKKELIGKIDPSTGYYYTTIDFNSDPKKENNVQSLANRFAGGSIGDLYAQLLNRSTVFSAGDVSSVRKAYAKNTSDVHVSFVRTCFNKDKPEQIGECDTKRFRATATVSNFGAYPAKDVKLRITHEGKNLEPDSFVVSGERCTMESAQVALCDFGTVNPNSSGSKVAVTGVVADVKVAAVVSANVSSSTPQNAQLLDEKQFDAKVSAGGGSIGFWGILAGFGLLVSRRRRRVA